ncbi:phage virion morphogenesis protein [Billgrantia gudaonensis]|uniref:Phage virion morphogenesis (Putative tail completion) protein n=1 Tax=Billgrantia gudaonensis TaxID=376427 RepID=A0A1G8TIP3_9GAMM|nr:phage virion morphogenesis protein [Halomonas gudaonensis]SDJ41476.1 phage virion morphogenesis (putative tail completion) protein [Halomonas gudaonensis]
MADDLRALEDWVDPLLERIEPRERARLARQIARQLRINQRQRIKAQQNPDGTAYEPRATLRGQSGSIRRKAMFSKLRTAKYLKAKGSASAATISFIGRVARIARVHHYGLRDRVEPGGPTHHYPERRLLGVSREDREFIRDSLIDHLT